jgi:hypothetical protein
MENTHMNNNAAGIAPPVNPESQVEENNDGYGGFAPTYNFMKDKNIRVILPKVPKEGGHYLIRPLPRPTPAAEPFPYYSPINPDWYAKYRAAKDADERLPSISELFWWEAGGILPTNMVCDANGFYYINSNRQRNDGSRDDHFSDPFGAFHYSAKWVVACEVVRQQSNITSQAPSKVKKLVSNVLKQNNLPAAEIAIADRAIGRMGRNKIKGEWKDSPRGGKSALLMQALVYQTPEDGPLAEPFHAVILLQGSIKSSFMEKVMSPHSMAEPHSLTNNGLGDFMSLDSGCCLRLFKEIEEGMPKYKVSQDVVVPLQEAHLTHYWKEWADIVHKPTIDEQVDILCDAYGPEIVGYSLSGRDGNGHFSSLLSQEALEGKSSIAYESYKDVKASPGSVNQAPPAGQQQQPYTPPAGQVVPPAAGVAPPTAQPSPAPAPAPTQAAAQPPVVQPPVQQVAQPPVVQPPVQQVAQPPVVQPPVQQVAQPPVVQPPVQQVAQPPVVQPPVVQPPVVQPPVGGQATAPLVQPQVTAAPVTATAPQQIPPPVVMAPPTQAAPQLGVTVSATTSPSDPLDALPGIDIKESMKRRRG